MASVTFETAVGGDGSTVTDDRDATTGLRGGGYRDRFVPALAQMVAVAGRVVDNSQAILNAPGTSATSTTSLTIGTGSKAFTIQTGKLFSIGQFMVAASTADPTDYMVGQVIAHDSGTGALTLNVTKTEGSGTIASWTLSLTGEPATALAAPSYLNQASDINLTVADMGTVLLSSTQAVNCYTPDATTLGDVRLLVLKNTGDFPIFVLDKSGNGLTSLASNTGCLLWCYDTGSTAGLWAALTDLQDFITTELVFSVIATSQFSACNLDTNKVLVVYEYNAATTRARVLTISDATLTAGAELTVFAGVQGDKLSVAQASTDKAVLVYNKPSSAGGEAVVISASGTTLSAGTPLVFNAGSSARPSVGRVATDKMVVIYNDSGNCNACVLSVSGTNLTAGAEVTVKAGSSGGHKVVAIGTDKAVSCYNVGSPIGAAVLTITGTSIAVGAELVVDATGSVPYLAPVTTDKAVITWTNSTPRAAVLSASGTTLTAGSTLTINSAAGSSGEIALIGTNELLVNYGVTSGSGQFAIKLAVSGTAITTSGSAVTLTGQNDSNDPALCSFATGKTLIAYRNSTTTFGAAYTHFKGALQ